MNKVTLHGRVAKDIDYRTTNDGLQIAKLSVVTNETYKKKDGEKVEKAEFHNVVFMGAKAEVINKYFKKGDGILLEGKLTHREYEKDGDKKYFTEVAGMEFHFPFGRPAQNQSTEKPRQEAANESDEKVDDDLPF